MLPFDIHQLNDQQTGGHADTIHHVEFDFYGKRLATVSSDKVISIWDRTGDRWVRSAYWKKHGGAVWKVRFAHPEYGQILATCSFDNTIHIYDKDATELSEKISHTGVHMGRGDSSNGWSRRAILSGTNANIIDIQFAPHYLGLRLAACTASGKVMIWEAEDIMALENWNSPPSGPIDASSHRLSSLTWSTNRFNLPLMVVASDELNIPITAKVIVFMFSPNAGFGNYKIAKDKFEFEEQVNDVSFGPSLALTYHKLAIAAGTKICIFQLHVHNDNDGEAPHGGGGQLTRGGGGSQNNCGELDFTKINCAVVENNYNSLVIRTSWNILGDVITAVYVDGVVRIFKYVFSNKWILISVINPPEEASASSRGLAYY